jgi:WD40 repeat protein
MLCIWSYLPTLCIGLQIWDISNYCISAYAKELSCDPHLLPVYPQLIESKKTHCNSRIPLDSLPAKPKYKSSKFRTPPLLCSWHAHLRGISSLSFVKEKQLVISGSNDCTVRLWTACGKYIGCGYLLCSCLTTLH